MEAQTAARQAEHEAVVLRVLERPVAVGPALGEEVSNRVVGLRDGFDVLGEAPEAVRHQRLEQPRHPTEQGVDGLRGGPDPGAQLAGP